MNYRFHFILLLILAFALILALCIAHIASDPLQIFSKGYFYVEKFEKNMRLQARGIIENVKFDSVILGTSMLENSSAVEASRLLGGEFVNMSMSGSSFYERHMVLGSILRKKSVKSVIYSFDYESYSGAAKELHAMDGAWTDLYDDNFINDFFVYYDKKYFMKSLFFLLESGDAHVASLEYFDRPNAWFRENVHERRFGGLENWVDNQDVQGVGKFLYERLPSVLSKLQPSLPALKDNEECQTRAITYINEYFLCFVRDNPSTKFYIVFPPYYRYVYAEMRQVQTENFSLHQKVIQYMVDAAFMYPNLEVYGFEDMDFLDNIANYKDTGHYAENINHIFTESIASKTHLLTQDTVHVYLQTCEKLASIFDIRKLYSEALAIAQKQNESR